MAPILGSQVGSSLAAAGEPARALTFLGPLLLGGAEGGLPPSNAFASDPAIWLRLLGCFDALGRTEEGLG